jgi:hypothetical protein
MNKLLLFQQKVGAISKDSTNPFFKSKYFDINKLIEEIKPILNELGLVLIQPLSLTPINEKPALRTILIDIESGKDLSNQMTPLPENNDPQKMGSIITYYRRYAIQSLLFLQAEDDDGNMAVKTTPKTVAKSAPVMLVNNKKNMVAKLLLKKAPAIKTASDYKDICMNLTGFELLPANYDTIINLLK